MPIIAITCERFEEGRVEGAPVAYAAAVAAAGGTPVLLPVQDMERLHPLIEHIHGLLLPGGYDLDPLFFGQEPRPGLGRVTPERDAFELALVQIFTSLGRPILGICRGLQLLAVARGGSLHQDIASERRGALKHRQEAPRWWGSHGVRLVPGTRLAAILGVEALRVNSFHHQAVEEPLPAPLVVGARAPDGVVEAFEDPSHPFFLAVQWHPEEMAERDPWSRRLFEAFVAACDAICQR